MVQHGESWYIVTVQFNVKSCSIYHQMIIWTRPDMLDNYCSLLTLWPLSVNMVCHWRSYMAILDWRHHLIRQGSLQIRGEAAGSGNPPSLTAAETAVYGFKRGWSTSRTHENPLQWCSTAFNSAVRHRQLTQQSSTGPACAELRCRATRQTAMVSCLAVRMSKWSNLLLFKHGVCSKRGCWYVYYKKKKRRWQDGQLMPVVLVPTI